LATPDGINKLIESGMDELCVSIWASNAETYSIVHPGAPASCFEKLKENLISLNKINRGRARVTFANVIVNNNFRDFQGMYEFGLNYGADAIYYTIADVFQGQTDKFLLDQEERAGLLRQAIELKERSKNYILQLEYFEGFLRRLSMPQGDFQKGEFDKSDINKIPCYVGWIFSRILADGGVAPCCRGVKKIMGNINEKSFKDIWFSDQYNDFRSRAKYSSKEVSYFREIGCIKECDNLMHNEEMNNRIKSNFS
jgi:MoaA/NifB/PqqE/SkfB family radical SAM enzyme